MKKILAKDRVLYMLMEDEFVSAFEIGEALGMSATTVRLHVNALQRDGYHIEKASREQSWRLMRGETRIVRAALSHITPQLGAHIERPLGPSDASELRMALG